MKLTINKNQQGLSRVELLLIITSVAFIAIIAIVIYILYMSTNQPKQETGISTFSNEIQQGGLLLESGNHAEAVAQFSRLVDTAASSEEKGQALLNLGVARIESNRDDAITILKEVAIDESYHIFTRAKATYYALSQFYGTRDESMAKEVIFSGPVWEDFYEATAGEEDKLRVSMAATNALRYAANLSPTVEVNARLAMELALFIDVPGTTQERKDQLAAEVQENVKAGKIQIEDLFAARGVRYGATHFSEVASAYNSLAMASAILYMRGYIQDSTLVTDLWEDALLVLFENGGSSDTEYFVRYHYADFLVRQDPEANQAAIIKILSPVKDLTTRGNAALYLKNKVVTYNPNDEKWQLYDEKILSHPANIIRLSAISVDFKQALINAGVPSARLD